MIDSTLSKTVLPLLPPAPVLSPEVAAKVARYNWEENEGGIKHPQWTVYNSHWNHLVNRTLPL